MGKFKNKYIKIRIKSDSNFKSFHLIYSNSNNAKSYSASILLNNYYRDICNSDKIKMRMERIEFSRNFLTNKQKLGPLKCTYCPKTNLVIELDGMSVPQNIIATIDHIQPISKGGGIFDVNNICVCCGSCNGKKADMLPEEWLNKINNI